MHKIINRDEKVIIITILSIIFVFSSSLIYPAISKKPEILKGKGLTSNGLIKSQNGIQTYSDQKGTQRISNINWGSLNPGMEKTISLFIENNNKESVILDLYLSNWSPPEMSNYLTLTWNYEGHSISFKEKIQVNFTLTVSEKITTEGNFNFDITILSIPNIT